ncbi:MAG: M23 family metallopeptidase [Anaerolineae bacterium]|nr:M23 family metallopeptidase [Gemmatimonadaceae bacterium]
MDFPASLARSRARLYAALISLVAATYPAFAQAPSLPPFLELRVPKPPTIASGEKGSFFAHELHVTNFMADTVTLKQVQVLTRGANQRALLSVSDSALRTSIARPGIAGPVTHPVKIAGGARAVVYLWVQIDPRSAPDTIVHRVTIEQGRSDSARTQQLDGARVPVARQAADIGPPLRGGVWLTANGPSNASGHRRALIPIDGKPSIAQRFAIDYVKVDDKTRRSTGDSLKNANYYAQGVDALAVADGIIVAIKDSIPENIPGIMSRAVPITLETVGGNHVIIDMQDGRYAFYAHLQPGSLRVKVGDRVRRGQVLGLVGNSGNSTEPHLHFHISDGNSPLGSEGMPYGHTSFEIVGHCRTFGSECERQKPTTRNGEQPMENTLVRFPE